MIQEQSMSSVVSGTSCGLNEESKHLNTSALDASALQKIF